MLCPHTHGRLLAIEWDGETVHECAACGKHVLEAAVSMDYIRRNLRRTAAETRRPAAVHGWAQRRPRWGLSSGARGAYLRVRMDGETRIRTLHPTWRVKYLKRP